MRYKMESQLLRILLLKNAITGFGESIKCIFTETKHTTMKIILGILLVAFSLNTYSQTPFIYEEVIVVNSNLKKEKIFTIINEYIASSYNSANTVIQLNDMNSGTIIIKGGFKHFRTGYLYTGYCGFVKYTLKIYVKDGKFKIIFQDFDHKGAGATVTTNLNTIYDALRKVKGMNQKWGEKNARPNVIEDINSLIKDTKENILKLIESDSKNSDW